MCEAVYNLWIERPAVKLTFSSPFNTRLARRLSAGLAVRQAVDRIAIFRVVRLEASRLISYY